MTLTEFLLARIAEDEHVANHADPSDGWELDNDFGGFSDYAPDGTVVASRTRVLAECEAKRAIVQRVGDDLYAYADEIRPMLHDPDDWSRGAEWGLAIALRALALPYADHPDYDEAWRA